ncbi:hypothetical protein AOLI_G00250110 [Acnodon oligacanthus]
MRETIAPSSGRMVELINEHGFGGCRQHEHEGRVPNGLDASLSHKAAPSTVSAFSVPTRTQRLWDTRHTRHPLPRPSFPVAELRDKEREQERERERERAD